MFFIGRISIRRVPYRVCDLGLLSSFVQIIIHTLALV